MNRQILKLAIPNIVTNITVPLLSMVDLSLMGHLASVEYIGAVSLGGIIFNFIYAIFGFLRMGTSGFTAQAFGKKDQSEYNLLFLRSLFIGFLAGLLLILLQYPIEKMSFLMLKGSDDVESLAASYFRIRIFAAPATLGLFALNGWFLGMQNARVPMVIAIVINILNIGFNLFFVMVLGMKSDGVALGTLLAQYSGLFLAGFFIWKYYREEVSWKPLNDILDTKSLKIFLQVNKDILIRSVCLIFTFTFFTAKSASVGDTTLAVNTILLQFFMIFSYLIDGFAYAAESLTGKFIGAGKRKEMILSVKYLFLWGLAIALVFTLIYLLWNKYLIMLLTDNEKLIEAIRPYKFWIILVPVITFSSFLWDGIFVGATASIPMRNTMLIATILIFLPSVFMLFPVIGNHGLWLAMILFMAARGLLMTYYSRKFIFKSQVQH